MTLHTRSDRPLTPDEADSVVQLAVMRAPRNSQGRLHTAPACPDGSNKGTA